MTVDLLQAQLDERVRDTPLEDRLRLHARLARQAHLLVWAQADRAGPMTPLELTRFLLRRLYPDLEGPRLDAIMARFAELEASGRWSGPQRPSPVASTRRGSRPAIPR